MKYPRHLALAVVVAGVVIAGAAQATPPGAAVSGAVSHGASSGSNAGANAATQATAAGAGNAIQGARGGAPGRQGSNSTKPRYKDTRPSLLTEGVKESGAQLGMQVIKHAVPTVAYIDLVKTAGQGVVKTVEVLEKGYDKRNWIKNEEQEQAAQQLIQNREQSGFDDLRKAMED